MSKFDITNLSSGSSMAAAAQLQAAEESQFCNPKHKANVFIAVIAAIIQSMNVQQQNESIQCKQLQSNASAQQLLNDQEATVHLVIFTRGMEYHQEVSVNHHVTVVSLANGACAEKRWTTKKVHTIKDSSVMYHLNISNEKNMAVRNCIGNQILLLRQNAQVGEAQLNSNVDQSQQTAQEGVGVMQMLVTVTNLILQNQH